MYEEFYVGSPDAAPAIFRAVDKAMDPVLRQEFIDIYHRDPDEKIVKFPQPRIKSAGGIIAPICVTEDWYLSQERKLDLEKQKEQKSAKVVMINLLTERDRLRYKIGKLDPTTTKGARKIALINIEIKNIEREIEILEEQNGCKCPEIDRGSKIGRTIGHIERGLKKFKKKCKKFFKRNEELIIGMASIILPVVASVAIKLLV